MLCCSSPRKQYRLDKALTLGGRTHLNVFAGHGSCPTEVRGASVCTVGTFTGSCWNAGATTAPHIFTGDVVITAPKSVPDNKGTQLAGVMAMEINNVGFCWFTGLLNQ